MNEYKILVSYLDSKFIKRTKVIDLSKYDIKPIFNKKNELDYRASSTKEIIDLVNSILKLDKAQNDYIKIVGI